MTKSIKAKLIVGLFAISSLVTGLASAATYPEKPINLIVAFSPGGGTDLVARLVAPYIEKYLGNGARIVVMNKPGAGGGIAFAEVARSPADGYTLGLVNTPHILTIPLERKSTFSWESFEFLGNLVDDPDSFAVLDSSPFKTLKDLTDYARANPDKVTVGTTGTGSDDHLAMLMFEKATGTKLSHVPYKGSSEVRSAIIGEQVAVAAINVGEVLQYVKSGTPLRMLGQMGAKRSNLAPNVPTFKEQGVKAEMTALRGFAAPKGLPADVKAKLVKAIAQAANDPEYQKRAAEIFAPTRYLAPAAYTAEVKETDAEINALWKTMPWGR